MRAHPEGVRRGRLQGEFDVDPQGPEARKLEAYHVPANEMASLMETAPHGVPRTAADALLPIRDLIQDALDAALTTEERWVFDATVVERKTTRAVALELNQSKSVVDRTKQRALSKLREKLSESRLVVDHLEGAR